MEVRPWLTSPKRQIPTRLQTNSRQRRPCQQQARWRDPHRYHIRMLVLLLLQSPAPPAAQQ
jgi:hypothetical protein